MVLATTHLLALAPLLSAFLPATGTRFKADLGEGGKVRHTYLSFPTHAFGVWHRIMSINQGDLDLSNYYPIPTTKQW
jgi:hypothetical protein